jgi:tetratricopeptide (TPR) repeat protein/transcriptional regulator with XRE-family HTH domain
MDAPPGRGDGFGTLLRTLRLKRGLTQEELAHSAGLSARAFGDMERGRTVPHRDTVGRLCTALELDEESRARLTALARAGWGARQRSGTTRDDAPPALPAPATPPATKSAVPAQLPWDIPDFIDRDGEITQLLDAGSGHSGGIWVIDGLGGVGKTALAVHVGHLATDRFPDGQLYLDLRGFDPHQPPVTPSAALGHLLRALGADQGRMLTAADELAAMFRSVLAGKRVLMILDNAASTDQVRPLLPGTSGCLVLVTSRHRLSGLAARHGAGRITLSSLDPGSAVTLLTGMTGQQWTRRDPDACLDLARLCGFLPLGLRIAAERARTGSKSLTSLITDLIDERDRLDLLTTDDESTSVRAVFSWSYHALEPQAAKLFRLLGLHPGSDFSVLAAAALADTDARQARHVVGRLSGANLVEQSGPDRFHFHDLMRAYVAELAVTDEPAATRDAAIRRLVGWYLAAAVTADRQISPQRDRPGLDEVQADHQLPPLRSYREAVDWCDAELANLVAVVRLASAAGQHAIAWRLAWALVGYLDLRRPWDAWLTSHQIALESARKARDVLGEAAILTGLGLAYYYPRLFAEAEAYCHDAQRLWQELGDRREETGILNAIANIRMETRDLDEAIRLYLRVLTVYRAIGDRRGEGVALVNLAEAHCELGRFDKVLEYAPAALQAARRTRNQRVEVLSLCHLARAAAAIGDVTAAEEQFLHALELARKADDRHAEAWTLDYLGTALVQAGRYGEAALSWEGAAALFEKLHDPQATSLRSRLSSLVNPG